jgi:hypothetical protein
MHRVQGLFKSDSARPLALTNAILITFQSSRQPLVYFEADDAIATFNVSVGALTMEPVRVL